MPKGISALPPAPPQTPMLRILLEEALEELLGGAALRRVRM